MVKPDAHTHSGCTVATVYDYKRSKKLNVSTAAHTAVSATARNRTRRRPGKTEGPDHPARLWRAVMESDAVTDYLRTHTLVEADKSLGPTIVSHRWLHRTAPRPQPLPSFSVAQSTTGNAG